MIAVTLAEVTDPAYRVLTHGHRVYTTLEGENPGGSIKDHMVHGALTELLKQGALRPRDAISEISAGSTALSLAVHGSALGLRVCVFIPKGGDPALSSRLVQLGAEVHEVEIARAYEEYRSYTARTGVRPFNQMGDRGKRKFYAELGRWLQGRLHVDLMIGAVGTGHSLLGLADALGPQARVISAEPSRGAPPVSGVRNVLLERHGEEDCCAPGDFEWRQEITADAHFASEVVETDLGPVRITPSFQLVLGALTKVLEAEQRPKVVFAVGAANARVVRPNPAA